MTILHIEPTDSWTPNRFRAFKVYPSEASNDSHIDDSVGVIHCQISDDDGPMKVRADFAEEVTENEQESAIEDAVELAHIYGISPAVYVGTEKSIEDAIKLARINEVSPAMYVGVEAANAEYYEKPPECEAFFALTDQD